VRYQLRHVRLESLPGVEPGDTSIPRTSGRRSEGHEQYCRMPKTSILRDPEAVREAVLASGSIKEALGRLNLRAAGGNYRALHEACARLGIEAPLCPPAPPAGRRWEPVPDAEVFCLESAFLNRGQIKLRLLRNGVPERCAICHRPPQGRASCRWATRT
jgi:hypothetical protein